MAGTKPLAAVPDAEAAVEKESTIKQRLLGQSMITLRERHREEYDEIARAAFREAGLTYKRRLTDQERAQEKIIELARANNLDVTITQSSAERIAD